MKKMAVFVEGQTERLFITRFIELIAQKDKIKIESCKVTENGRLTHLIGQSKSARTEFYFLVVDCGSDSRVASEVRDNFENLVASKFTSIIGIRDVYPLSYGDIPSIRKGMLFKQRTKPFAPKFLLSIMEIEAWFLSEYTHMLKVHPSLTPENIASKQGFNPSLDDMSQRPHPAEDLGKIYGMAGQTYGKNKRTVQRTVEHLDCETMYLTADRMPELKLFVQEVDVFCAA